MTKTHRIHRKHKTVMLTLSAVSMIYAADSPPAEVVACVLFFLIVWI